MVTNWSVNSGRHKLSENMWFAWSNTCYKGEKVRRLACDGCTDRHTCESRAALCWGRTRNCKCCQCHSWLSGNNDCNEFRLPVVRNVEFQRSQVCRTLFKIVKLLTLLTIVRIVKKNQYSQNWHRLGETFSSKFLQGEFWSGHALSSLWSNVLKVIILYDCSFMSK